MNCHMHIKPKITLRNWLLNKSEHTKGLLHAFDAECEEVTCEHNYKEYLTNGDLVMDVKAQQVTLAGSPVKLSRTMFALLEYLMRRQEQCIPYEEILNALWSCEHQKKWHYIRVFVYELRMALSDKEQRIIKTVQHVGLIMNRI